MLNFIVPPVGDINIGPDEIESVENTHGFALWGMLLAPALARMHF